MTMKESLSRTYMLVDK